jgi:hypothetical protein
MMRESLFDASNSDSQGTAVEPVSPGSFDAARYADYCAALEEKCARFWSAPEGVCVHRRFRVPQVYAGACRDMKTSLAFQLGALKRSMDFVMDIPNFLEPWYGIGAAACAYGAQYIWEGNLAPATAPVFRCVEDALAHEPAEIAETAVGKHTLDMIEYFLEKTGGKVPLCFSDVQSPLDAAAALVDTAAFYMDMIDNPEGIKKLLDRVAALELTFYRKQAGMIGRNLVFPGHGFSSCRVFTGLGFSDDNSIMLSPEDHRDICGASMVRMGEEYGGFAFHSCGNWSKKTETLKTLPGLKAVDAAFTSRTDPDPNPAAPFRVSFAGTGISLNARMAGSAEEASRAAAQLLGPGMKLIAVTYCAGTEEHTRAYEAIHAAG